MAASAFGLFLQPLIGSLPVNHVLPAIFQHRKTIHPYQIADAGFPKPRNFGKLFDGQQNLLLIQHTSHTLPAMEQLFLIQLMPVLYIPVIQEYDFRKQFNLKTVDRFFDMSTVQLADRFTKNNSCLGRIGRFMH